MTRASTRAWWWMGEAGAARAMLRAVGFRDADFARPQIGVASTWATLTPVQHAHRGAGARGPRGGRCGRRQERAVQHDHCLRRHLHGHPGHALLAGVARDIADSIEAVVGAAGFDGFVAIGGCDKNMPGCAMAMARLNRPSVFVYGGTIRPGSRKRRDIVSVFEAVGARSAGKLADASCSRSSAPPSRAGQLRRDVHREHHGLGHRGPGLSLRGAPPRRLSGEDKRADSRRPGEAVVRLRRGGLEARATSSPARRSKTPSPW